MPRMLGNVLLSVCREMNRQDLKQQQSAIRLGPNIDSYEDDAGPSVNVSHERTAAKVDEQDRGAEGAAEGIESLLDEGEDEDLSGSYTGERQGRGGQIEVEVWRDAGRLEALRVIESAELEVCVAHCACVGLDSVRHAGRGLKHELCWLWASGA